jgi:hypothetical protein
VTLVVGLVIAGLTLVAAVVVPLYIWRRQRTKAELSYEVTSGRIVDIGAQAAGRVEVRFDGTPVPDVALITARVRNSGNVPIRANHFERPLTVTLPAGITILDHRVGDTRPDGLKPALAVVADNEVAIEPLLLNPHDAFDVEILVSGPTTPVVVSGRLEGIADITAEPSAESRAEISKTVATRQRVLAIAAVVIAAAGGVGTSAIVAFLHDGLEPKFHLSTPTVRTPTHDPFKEECVAEAVTVPRARVVLGDALLRAKYSASCEAAWAEIDSISKLQASQISDFAVEVHESDRGSTKTTRSKGFHASLADSNNFYTNFVYVVSPSSGVCITARAQVRGVAKQSQCLPIPGRRTGVSP